MEEPTEAGGAQGRVAGLLPWVLATGIFGVSFGSVGSSLGVSGTLLVASSALVFSPSVQFAAVGLAAGQGAVAAALVTGLMLASRLFVVGAAISPTMEVMGWRRLLASQLVIDASVLAALRASGNMRRRAYVDVGTAVYVSWVGGTALGSLVADGVGDLDRLGLDAAMPSLFLALVAPLLTDRRGLAALLAGGVVAVATTPWLPVGAPVLLACAVGTLLALRTPAAL